MKPTQLKTKIPADFSVHIDGFPKNFDIDIYLAKLLILINHKPSLETHELAKKNWLDRYNRLLDTKKQTNQRTEKINPCINLACLGVCLFVCLFVWVFGCLFVCIQ